MRFLLLTDAIGFGGLASYLFTLGKALRDQGHDCWVAARAIHAGALKQAAWCGFPADRIILGPQSLGEARSLLRELEIDRVLTSPPMGILGDPNPYDLGVPEACLLHSHYSAVNWRANGRKVFANDETLRKRYGGLVMACPVDLERFRFDPDLPRAGVVSAGRLCKETLAIVEEAGVPVDFYGAERPEDCGSRGQVMIHEARPLEEVLPHYQVAIGAGLVAIEAMASGCLTLVGQNTLDPNMHLRPSLDGLMTGLTVERAARYNYRGFMVRRGDRLPWRAYREAQEALALPPVAADEIRREMRAWVEQRHDARKIAQQLVGEVE